MASSISYIGGSVLGGGWGRGGGGGWGGWGRGGGGGGVESNPKTITSLFPFSLYDNNFRLGLARSSLANLLCKNMKFNLCIMISLIMPLLTTHSTKHSYVVINTDNIRTLLIVFIGVILSL